MGHLGIRHLHNLLREHLINKLFSSKRNHVNVTRRRNMNHHHVKTLTTLHNMPSRIIYTVNHLHIYCNLPSTLPRSRMISHIPRRTTKMGNMSVISVTRRDKNATYRRNIYRQRISTIIRARRLTNLKMSRNILRLTRTMNVLRRTHHSTMPTISLSSPINRRIGTMRRIPHRTKFLHRRSSQFNTRLPRRTTHMNMMNAVNTRSTRIMPIRPTRIYRYSRHISTNIRPRNHPRTFRVEMVEVAKTISHIIRDVMSRNQAGVSTKNVKRLLRVSQKRLKRNRDNIFLLQIVRRSTTLRATTMKRTSRTIHFICMSQTRQGGTLFYRLPRLNLYNNGTLNTKRHDGVTTIHRNHGNTIHLLRLNHVLTNRNIKGNRIIHANYRYNDKRRNSRRGTRYTRHEWGSLGKYFRTGDPPRNLPINETSASVMRNLFHFIGTNQRSFTGLSRPRRGSIGGAPHLTRGRTLLCGALG